MSRSTDETHDPVKRSWIESANDAATDFPLQNLPWAVFRDAEDGRPVIGVGIGDVIVNCRAVAEQRCLSRLNNHPIASDIEQRLMADRLNDVMSLHTANRQALRRAMFELLHEECPVLRDDLALRGQCLVPMKDAEYCLPAEIGDYTDFYASLYHATNVGSMFRPDNPLLPNYRWIPIGYHGRCSSIVVSGQEIRRPVGQTAPPQAGAAPKVQASRMLDHELEVAIWIGPGNVRGQPVPIAEAEEHFFGVGLLNDWSARDLQRWEYQPLGPFLAKSFASTVSPWIVTREALAPFRVPAPVRAPDDPAPLPYLDHETQRTSGAVALTLEVTLSSHNMRTAGFPPLRLSCADFRSLYWTIGQMITHHASNGCNLRPGDLLGSGTVSGPDRSSRGCLLELTWDGEFGHPVPGTQRTPLKLPTGEERMFLADGDEVVLTGHCTADGFRTIGLGTCRGTVVAAPGAT